MSRKMMAGSRQLAVCNLALALLAGSAGRSNGASLPPILGFQPSGSGFQPTGSDSGWAWGKDLSATGISARKFHLWRLAEGRFEASKLPQELSTPSEDTFPGVSFLDRNRGFIVWTQDRISEGEETRFTVATAATVDGGNSWEVRKHAVSVGFTFLGVNQLQFTDEQNGHLIVGIDGAAGSTFKTLLHTRDGGRSWEADPASRTVVGNENAPIHMLFRSRSDGWILSAGVHGQAYPNIWLRHTTNGGRSWHSFDRFASPAACRPDCSVQGVGPMYFEEASPGDAFFVVSFVYGSAQIVRVRFHTHDGGASWSAPETFRPPAPSWNFADFAVGMASDRNGVFLTRDSGRTWSINPPLTRILAGSRPATSGVLYRRNDALWFVTQVDERTNFFCSVDEGRSWRAMSGE